MPSTSQAQHNLMAGVANSPSFARKVGIDRKVGEEYMKADRKQKTFWKGSTQAKVAKQNTGHGKMDMPFAQLNKYVGKKSGGIMKRRRFDEGGDVDSDIEYTTDEDGNEIAISRKSYAGGVRASTPTKAAPKPKAKPKAKVVETKEVEVKAPETRLSPRDVARQSAAPFRSYLDRYKSVRGMKSGGAVMRSKKGIAADQMSMAPFRKGGGMKEPKEMVKKEVSFMKKKGAPASMVKHEEAEMKYARGGGIESRGKTKGKIIKMAGGGFVRSADGCAQRGKTKGKMVR